VRDASLCLPLPQHRLERARLRRDDPERADETYEPVTCTVCARVHLVNPKTGKVLGADE